MCFFSFICKLFKSFKIMIRKLLTICILQCAVFGFSQNLRPVAAKVSEYQAQKKTFEKYDLFTLNNN